MIYLKVISLIVALWFTLSTLGNGIHHHKVEWWVLLMTAVGWAIFIFSMGWLSS